MDVYTPERIKLDVSLVPLEYLAQVWPVVGPMLKRATDQSEGRYELEDLRKMLACEAFQLWVIFEPDMNIVAAITSTFTQYPQGKFLSGQFLGGERLDDWKDMFLKVFDQWGRDNDCDFVELTGRAGWSKVLAPNGYRELYRTYQRDLR